MWSVREARAAGPGAWGDLVVEGFEVEPLAEDLLHGAIGVRVEVKRSMRRSCGALRRDFLE